MKKRLSFLFFSLLLLTACNPVKEAQEAVINLGNEAVEIQANVKNTVDQFNQTVESVNEAKENIQDLTNPKSED